MADLDHINYYNSEREIPKVSHLDFSVMPSDNFEEQAEELIKFLVAIEPKYKKHFRATKRFNLAEPKVYNEIFNEVYREFACKINLIRVYKEVVDFFQFPNREFYSLLLPEFKKKLYSELSKRVETGSIVRAKKREQSQRNGGAVQKTISGMML